MKEDHLDLSECKVTAQALGELVKMIVDGKVSNNQAKSEVFEKMYESGNSPEVVVKELGISVVSDTGAIEAMCKAVLEKHPGPVADFKGGKDAAIGFLVGQVLKESKGKAQPAMVSEMLRNLMK